MNYLTMSTREDLVVKYFREGFSYKEIISLLSSCHDVNFSIRTLHRILKRYNLMRKNRDVNIYQVLNSIAAELRTSNSQLGYRAMHQKLCSKGVFADRETVRLAVKCLDPEGVELRRKHKLTRRKYSVKGPNHVWHVDGNDKLKPFGFCIHGCIDGYSRKLLWLTLCPSNKDPGIIATYYLDYVCRVQGVPKIVRADRGVENSTIAGMQRYFHRTSPNAVTTFLFGKSTSNQRIEAWWSFLRKSCLQWWINYFKDLRDQGLFDDSNPIHVECLRFCLYGVLQDELTKVLLQWNHHRIRPVRHSESPPGRPDVLYYTRENIDVLKKVDNSDVILARTFCKIPTVFGCSLDFAKLALLHMQDLGLTMPKNFDEAERLYLELIYCI